MAQVLRRGSRPSLLRGRLGWLFIFLLGCTPLPTGYAGEEPGGDLEEYEPPPEGFEERYYSILGLISRPTDFQFPEGPALAVPPASTLNAEQIVEIIKYCAAPETWTRRGPARMQPDARGKHTLKVRWVAKL